MDVDEVKKVLDNMTIGQYIVINKLNDPEGFRKVVFDLMDSNEISRAEFSFTSDYGKLKRIWN